MGWHPARCWAHSSTNKGHLWLLRSNPFHEETHVTTKKKNPHKYKIPQLKNLGCCKHSAQTSTRLFVQRNNYIWKLMCFKRTLIHCSATSSFPPPNHLLQWFNAIVQFTHTVDCHAPKRCLCICSSQKQCRHTHTYTAFARDFHSYCTGVYTNKYSMAVLITVAYSARIISPAKRKVHFRLGLFPLKYYKDQYKPSFLVWRSV